MNIRDYLSSEHEFCAYISGRAGAGKSTLMRQIMSESDMLTLFALDDYFIGDTKYRKKRTEEALKSQHTFWSHCLMSDWWDWESLISDLQSAKYNHRRKLVVEGALLPACSYWRHFDSFFIIHHK